MRNILIHEHEPPRTRPHEDACAGLGIQKKLESMGILPRIRSLK
jgi:hypothetical protein